MVWKSEGTISGDQEKFPAHTWLEMPVKCLAPKSPPFPLHPVLCYPKLLFVGSRPPSLEITSALGSAVASGQHSKGSFFIR